MERLINLPSFKELINKIDQLNDCNSIPPLKYSTKRSRRKFNEINRKYKCNYKKCEKSYGTLNHLNSHILSKDHGNKRFPNEFK